MIYPLQVLTLLLITAMFRRSSGDAVQVHSATLVLLEVLLANATLCAAVWAAARRSVRQLYHVSADATRVAGRFARFANYAVWLSVGLLVYTLWWGGFGPLVARQWGLGQYPFLPQVIFIAVPVADWFFFWAVRFGVDRAANNRALPYRLALALPVHEPVNLGRYLLLQARLNLWLLLLEIPLAATDHLLQHGGWLGINQQVAQPMALGVDVAAFLALPWFLTRIWSTQSMAPGPLRDRLEALAARYHIGFIDIRVWNTDHMVQNAMILGPARRCRYFLLTDALLESLTDQQIEAVFAHEVGHGHHRHVLWYLAGLVGASMVAWAGAEALHRQFPHWFLFSHPSLVQVLLLGAYLLLAFTYISRQCEHQADWFAVRHMAQADVPVEASGWVARHDGGVSGGAAVASAAVGGVEEAAAQNLMGAEIFSDALFRIVTLSNRSTERGGAMHPSPVRRAEFLRTLAVSPAAAQRFDRFMVQLRVAIVLLLAVGVAAWLIR